MIDVRDVSYLYPRTAEPAVAHITLRVERSERVGIVGPNGSGKSTVGRLMKGLLLPAEGAVLVDGVDSRFDGLDVRRRVGLVFQNPNSQIVNSVIEQEVAFGPENLGLPPSEIRDRVDEALHSVGLRGREQAECHSLSMADKQRVALAAVMAMRPDYLVLDEPTAWIEPSARWSLLEEVARWASQGNVGLVLITHRMDEAQLCHRVVGILHGRLETAGTAEQVLRDERVRSRLSLEMPETAALADELRAAGLPIGEGIGIRKLADTICQS